MALSISDIGVLINNQPDLNASVEERCLAITNDEGLEAFLTIGEQQILVEALLFPKSAVKDDGALNDKILRTMFLVPLSSVAIKQIGGDEYYVAFGALSVDSKESVIVEEVTTLFANVDDFIELYSDNLVEVS